MNLPLPAPPPPTELIVIGEHRSDPMCLLLFGVDGQFYCYSLTDEDITPVEPNEDWHIEQQPSRDLIQVT